MSLKTCNTEFDKIIITFMDQNGRPSEMTQYTREPRTRKYVKGYGFLSFARKYWKQ